MSIFSFSDRRKREEQEEQFRRRMEDQLSKLIEGKEEEGRFLEKLSRDVRQTGTDIRKHSMALEDCLDMLEEQQERETQSQKRIKELEEERGSLLELLDVYQEQLWNMRRYAQEHDPAWVAQLELARNVVKDKEIISGVSLIDEPEVKVDYTLHEVIEIRDTHGGGMPQTIAQIFHPGYAYRGEVKKKAKVAAYR